MKNIYLVECHPLMRIAAESILEFEPEIDEFVVVKFKDCKDIGRVVEKTQEATLGVILRKATDEEISLREKNKEWEDYAMKEFKKIIQKYSLPMKIIDVHSWMDRKKIAFYFVADKRLDFRKAHKEIANILKCRVVIKQIGIRDYARYLGGVGPCGRELCCSTFLKEIRPVSLRDARRQNLYVDPEKISGMCGKLLCCLLYEKEVYARIIKNFPRIGERIKTATVSGEVIGIDLNQDKIFVRTDEGHDIYLSIKDLKKEDYEDS